MEMQLIKAVNYSSAYEANFAQFADTAQSRMMFHKTMKMMTQIWAHFLHVHYAFAEGKWYQDT